MTVYEKIIANHYRNQMEPPKRPSRFPPIKEREAEYKAAKRAYDAETRRLTDLFKADALDEVGLTGHPKAEKAWELAWDRGKSPGLTEVLGNLEELAELLL